MSSATHLRNVWQTGVGNRETLQFVTKFCELLSIFFKVLSAIQYNQNLSCMVPHRFRDCNGKLFVKLLLKVSTGKVAA